MNYDCSLSDGKAILHYLIEVTGVTTPCHESRPPSEMETRARQLVLKC